MNFMRTILSDFMKHFSLYKIFLPLYRLAMRFGFSDEFLQISDFLHRRFGFPALQPVRVHKK
ncbi:MAG: hypothetical protein KH050_09065 [Clostridiaceae bacterium]|nr:hypothetical protein [Clostridiaceae bacterium]